MGIFGAEFPMTYTVKSEFNDHPRDPKTAVVVRKWSLFIGHLFNKSSKWDIKKVGVVNRWTLAQVNQCASVA